MRSILSIRMGGYPRESWKLGAETLKGGRGRCYWYSAALLSRQKAYKIASTALSPCRTNPHLWRNNLPKAADQPRVLRPVFSVRSADSAAINRAGALDFQSNGSCANDAAISDALR